MLYSCGSVIKCSLFDWVRVPSRHKLDSFCLEKPNLPYYNTSLPSFVEREAETKHKSELNIMKWIRDMWNKERTKNHSEKLELAKYLLIFLFFYILLLVVLCLLREGYGKINQKGGLYNPSIRVPLSTEEWIFVAVCCIFVFFFFIFFLFLINKTVNKILEGSEEGGGDNDQKDDKDQKKDNEKEDKEKEKGRPHGKDDKTDGGPQSPLDQFSIVPFYPLQIGKLYFSFTNASFFLLLTLSFVLFLFHLVTQKGGGKLVGNACQSVLELIYDFVPNLVNEQIGGLSGNVKQKYFPCISVTFTFSLFRNLQGMIPYSFTVTSHFLVTLGLSFSLFIGITIVGFAKNGLHFLSFSLPAGVPLPLAPFLVLLELIPHCFRALSLGIRLFANMMAGHSLVKILSGFAWTMLCMNDLFYFIGSTGPFFIVLALTGLELGVAILQAYVFTILMCIYLNDAINLH